MFDFFQRLSYEKDCVIQNQKSHLNKTLTHYFLVISFTIISDL